MSSTQRSNINITPSAPNEGGLLGRLMQRTRSLRDTTRKSSFTHETALRHIHPESKEERETEPASVQPGLTRPAPQFIADVTAPENDTMVQVFRQPQPTPGLRKRASIRDRLRSLGRETPREQQRKPQQLQQQQQQQTPKPRIVYVPTHAASDFSRLAVSTGSRYFSEEEARANTNEADLSRQPYLPRRLQTLAEDEPERGTFRPIQPQPEGRIDSSRVQDTKPANGSEQSRTGESGQQEESDSEPSDFEVFLTRAEQEDRAYREHLVRTLGQRPWARPYTADPEVGHQSSYPNHAHDSAVVTDPSVPRKQAWEDGRVSRGVDSGIGSKSSSGNGTWERGHRKRTSLTLSLGRGDADETGGYTTAAAAAVPDVGSAQSQQPRTLKKQISIKKKLGEYIRPAKVQRPLAETVYEG